MVCLGFELGAAGGEGWKVQTNPLCYDGPLHLKTLRASCHSSESNTAKNCVYYWSSQLDHLRPLRTVCRPIGLCSSGNEQEEDPGHRRGERSLQTWLRMQKKLKKVASVSVNFDLSNAIML